MDTIVAFLVALGLAHMAGQPERAVDTNEIRSVQAQIDVRAERIHFINAWLRSTRQVRADDSSYENKPGTLMVAGNPTL